MRLLIIFLLTLSLYGTDYSINSGWQLLGTQDNIDVSSLSNTSIKYIWVYRDGKWYCHTNDDNIKKLLNKNGILSFDYIMSKEGFWIYSTSNFNLSIQNSTINDSLNLKKGWQLVSLPYNKVISVNELNNSAIDIIWKYLNGDWIGFSPVNYIQELIDQYFSKLISISPNEGFWVKANSDFNLSFQTYSVNLFAIKDDIVTPLRFEDVYDENGKLIGKSDFYGHINLTKPKRLFLSDKYDFQPVVMSDDVNDYVLLAQIVSETNSTYMKSSKSDFIDIKDYRLLPQEPVAITAAVIPKVFMDFSDNYGLIVKKFYIKSDATLSVISSQVTNAIGAFKINLEDSFGNEVTPEEIQFSGEFKPFMKYDGNESRFVLMINDNGEWKFLSDAYLLNGKIYSKNYVSEVGEYAFFTLDDIYKHTVCTNVKSILFDSVFYPRIANKCTSFYSFSKDENITIIADGYEQTNVIVGESANVTLKEKPFMEQCAYLYDLNNTSLSYYPVKVDVGEYSYELNTDKDGAVCVASDTNITDITINGISYSFADKIKVFQPFKTLQTNAVTYSDIANNVLVYNTITGSQLYDLTSSKNFSIGSLYFNSYAISSVGIVFGDIAGNLYFYDKSNEELNQAKFSSEDFFEDIGRFVNSGVAGNSSLFFPTTNGYIVTTTLDGNNSYESPIKLNTNDANMSNDLVYMYDINETNSYAVVYEGLIYVLDKSKKSVELITSTSTPLNLYNSDYRDLKLYYIDNGKLKYINNSQIVETQIYGDRVKLTQNYIAVENGNIKIYDNNLNLIKEIEDSNLLKLFEYGNSLVIATSNGVYIDNEKVTFGSEIANIDYSNGIFVIELKNGKVFLSK